MATTTLPKTGLNKQDEGDVDWETALNTGFDNLESRIERTFAGDPNGNVAGYWIGQPCWDSTNNRLYLCTTTGNAANAVWTEARVNYNFAGDPNGNLGADYVGEICWDTSNQKLYIATGTGDAANATWLQFVSGGGHFKGENGSVGSDRIGDIFRVNEQTLNSDVTIESGENASCAGPLTIASGVTLTVNGNLTIV
jgi:hypothetical protein